MYTLYTAAFSSNGRKAVALTRHLHLAPRIVEVNVYRGEGRSPEFLAVNPWGKVPTLVDGDLTLWESNAILEYISEAYGDLRLWSREPKARANIARWLYWESAHWQPMLTEVLGQHAGHVVVPNLAAKPEGKPEWDAPVLQPLVSHLDGHLARSEFLADNDLSIADFSVATMAIYFRRLSFPFDDYPAFTRWYRRIHALDAWRTTNVEPWVP